MCYYTIMLLCTQGEHRVLPAHHQGRFQLFMQLVFCSGWVEIDQVLAQNPHRTNNTMRRLPPEMGAVIGQRSENCTTGVTRLIIHVMHRVSEVCENDSSVSAQQNKHERSMFVLHEYDTAKLHFWLNIQKKQNKNEYLTLFPVYNISHLRKWMKHLCVCVRVWAV